MRQWPTLDPLTVPPRLLDEARYQQPLLDNDEVDAHMLAALDAEAVDFLITQDRALRRHAAYAGLGDRTMTIQDGIEASRAVVGRADTVPDRQAVSGVRAAGGRSARRVPSSR